MRTAMDETIPSPRDPHWGQPPFPAWLREFRDGQWEGAQQAIDAFRKGYKFVLCEAPTGQGKSALAEIVRRELKLRTVYLCSTRQLQTQIEDAFPYAALLWGRKNYETVNYPARFPAVNASLCDKDEEHDCVQCEGEFVGNKGCTLCCPDVSKCPYEQAKSHALGADLAVLNFSMYLTEANFVGRFGEKVNKTTRKVTRNELVIADECDTLEDTLMGFVEVNISPRRREQFKIPAPRLKTVESAWIEWAEETSQYLGQVLKRLPPRRDDERRMRDRQWVNRTREQVVRLAVGLQEGGWVYDEGRGGSIVFRPVKVDREAPRSLWRHADRFLMLSATICAPDIMARDLGLEDGTWTSFSLPSTFDKRRRPIYLIPVAYMTNKTKDTEWPKMAKGLGDVLRVCRDRVLVPTVSYALNTYLMNELKEEFGSRLVTYNTAAERVKALERYRGQEGAVLMAPSMDRGVDLRDEDCRYIVIVKVPWPNRGDKQVSKRLHGDRANGEAWYTVNTIRRLVQMTGRGMRHEDDYCTSIIMDGTFTKLFNKYGRWFPAWWKESISWQHVGRGAMDQIAAGVVQQHVTRNT